MVLELMEAIVEFLNKNKEIIGLLMMPFTYGFVGWFTNWVALKMTFYPLEFVGIPPFLGWQGIIPRKAYKMASKSVDIISTRLLRIEEVFAKVEPEEVVKELRPLMNEISADLIRDVIDDINPNLWNLLPENIREEIVKQVQSQNKDTIQTITDEMRANVYEIFDLKGLVLKSLTGPNVALIVEMFQSVGKKEFKFIERSGLYFGFLLGMVQMLVWNFFPLWWTLPLQGVVVGYLTNWLAINMIFRPQRPVQLGPLRYQGLFHRRQAEVSEQYAHLVATRILTPKKIMDEILYGRAAEKVYSTIRRAVGNAVERSVEFVKPVVFLTLGNEKYEEIKRFIVGKLTRVVPRTTKNLENYLEKAMDLERTMADRMKALTPEEFETVLRSAFQEDEFLLILVGAVLGGLVGLAQAFFMLST